VILNSEDEMNKKLFSILFSMMLIVIFLAGCSENNNQPTNNDTDNNGDTTDQDTNEDQNTDENQNNDEDTTPKNVTFTAHMFELEKVNYIVPLGELEGGWEEMEVNNMALVHIKREGDYGTPSLLMEVYAPTDITLTSYSYYSYGDNPSTWTLIFEINSDITLKLSALTDVVDKIKNTVGTEFTSGEINLQTSLSFTPGEKVGYAGGSADVTNWDVLCYDKNHENQYVNQERYQATYLGERYLTAVCAFNFYPDEIKQDYIDLMGFGAPGLVSDCGNASRDVAGTLSGIWWLSIDGTDIEEQDVFTSPLMIYSNSAGGTSLGYVNKKRYKIRSDNPTNKDPATITTEHCYKLLSAWDGSTDGYAYFKIISDTEMHLATGTSGSCPSMFPDDYMTYYR
jgi:hypothetical protein